MPHPPSVKASAALSEKRFRELILYVARESQGDPRCGATKLNKILFYADFGAFRRTGSSISGRAYRKQEYGPVPDRMTKTLDAMVARGLCAWQIRDYYGLALKKLIPLREPDLSQFTGAEVDLIQRVIRELWELNATEVSDLSHRFVGWQIVEMGERIPYETVFIGEARPLSDDETQWALGALREFHEQQGAT